MSIGLAPPAIRVLLVEDDDAYADLLAAEMASPRLAVALQRCRTLREGLSAAAQAAPDVILLDLGLPDSGGADTVARVHADVPGVPIVVLTASDDEALSMAAVHAGADDYLLKSDMDPRLLARTLRYACERAALRREIVEREARFRALVEHSYDAITLLDEHFRAVYHSRAIERVTGFKPDERLGEPLDPYVHPDDKARIQEQFARCVASPGELLASEYRFLHKDGSWRYGEALVVNRLHDPAVRAIVVNHRDITERTEAEEALRRSEEQLRQAHKMEAVGRLAGGVAHDFNNVLTAIFGYTDLLLEQFDADDPRRADVEEIKRSAERAASLTRQLLAFSRKQIMQPRVIDLNEVLANLHKLLLKLVGDDVQLRVTSDPGLWSVRADPGQMEQVFMNLAANARDAMPDGGVLSISTANRHLDGDAVTRLPGLAPGEFVAITVSDTGSGMSEAVRRHLFEPFFTTKEHGKGTGLGLPMVYGIVKQTGGGIYAESEEGQGTTFVVYLPRVPSSSA